MQLAGDQLKGTSDRVQARKSPQKSPVETVSHAGQHLFDRPGGAAGRQAMVESASMNACAGVSLFRVHLVRERGTGSSTSPDGPNNSGRKLAALPDLYPHRRQTQTRRRRAARGPSPMRFGGVHNPRTGSSRLRPTSSIAGTTTKNNEGCVFPFRRLPPLGEVLRAADGVRLPSRRGRCSDRATAHWACRAGQRGTRACPAVSPTRASRRQP